MNMKTSSPASAEPQHLGRILFAMSFSLVLVVASMSSLNLSLPELSIGIGATNTELTWIADAYTLVLAATVLSLGAIGDRYGRRTVLLIGTVIFGLAALYATFQTTANGLIVGRAFMGLGAAMIMPGTLSTITAAFPPEKRARGVATWVGFAGAGAVIGMLAAGILLEFWGWESIFAMSAITAVFSGAAALMFAPNTIDEGHVKLDILGSLFSATFIGALVFGIIHGGEDGWTSPLVLTSFGLSLAAGVAFVVWELRNEHPLLDVRLFRKPWFSMGALAVTAQFMAQLGFLFIAMQYLQIVLGFSPLKSAVGFMPLAIAVLPMSMLAPFVVERFGTKPVVVTGVTLLAIGLVLMGLLDESSSYLSFMIALLVLGLGVAWTATPSTTAITSSLPRSKQGVASAVNDTTREVGSALGVALMGTVYAASYESSISSVADTLPEGARETVLRSAAAGIQLATQYGERGEAMIPQITSAFMDGASDAMFVVAGILVVVAATIFIVAPRRIPEENLSIDDEVAEEEGVSQPA